MARILLIEDEAILRRNIVDRIRADGHEVVDAGTAEAGIDLATLLAPDLVITDLRLPGQDGLHVLREVRRISPRCLVVLLTAHGSRDTALEAIRDGAYDYLTKPVELRDLMVLIERAIRHARALDAVECNRLSERRRGTLDAIIGVSPAIQELRLRVRQLAAAPAMKLRHPPTILIRGETGVGKTLLAHAIHNEGPRRDGPFVHVTAGGDDGADIETELFGDAGHGGGVARRGLFEMARGGTLFLDEISRLPADARTRLSAVMERRTISVAGGAGERPIDVQIIAATQFDLRAAVQRGEFRGDLFHRLNEFVFEIPPLRERTEDVSALAAWFVGKHAERLGRPAPRLSDAAVAALQSCPWPGNAREMSHAIDRALLVCSDCIEPEHLMLPVAGESPGGGGLTIRLPGETIELDFERDCLSLDEVEQRILRAAFAHTNGNLSRTARLLGLTREAVRYRLARSEAPTPSAAPPQAGGGDLIVPRNADAPRAAL